MKTYHIGPIDHIVFTLYRLKNNDEIANPFIVEIQTFYKKKSKIALKAVDILKIVFLINILLFFYS